MFDHRIATDPYYPLIVVMNYTITLNALYLFHWYVLKSPITKESSALLF